MAAGFNSHFSEMLVLKLLSVERLSISEIKKTLYIKSDGILNFSIKELSVCLFKLRNDKCINENLIGSEDVLYNITEKGYKFLIQYIDVYRGYTDAADKILME